MCNMHYYLLNEQPYSNLKYDLFRLTEGTEVQDVHQLNFTVELPRIKSITSQIVRVISQYY